MIANEKSALGRMSRGEAAVAAVFALTALGWVFQPLLEKVVPLVSDTGVAIAGALLLFMIPAGRRQGCVMNWDDTRDIPWGVLLLFGGGLSLASAIERHGLATYLGSLAGGLQGMPLWLVVSMVAFGILMLTELTSNTATAATFLPVAGALAVSLGQDPLVLLIPVALAANCAFMLPVGTPPNAIVFASGMITLPQMARTGILLNLLAVPVVVGVLWLLGPWVFGIATAR
jgi:sodium-dependent dicarboxylate transporter 2/3/5